MVGSSSLVVELPALGENDRRANAWGVAHAGLAAALNSLHARPE
jgi:hypothetical protein